MRLFTEEEILDAIKQLCKHLEHKFYDRSITLMYIKDGATPFKDEVIHFCNLNIKEIIPIKVKSYTGEHSGQLIWEEAFECYQVRDKDVLLLDDIFDSGKTLLEVSLKLLECECKSLTTCVLLEKKKYRSIGITPSYSALQIEDLFVYGFGMDLDGKLRELREIYVKE